MPLPLANRLQPGVKRSVSIQCDIRGFRSRTGLYWRLSSSRNVTRHLPDRAAPTDPRKDAKYASQKLHPSVCLSVCLSVHTAGLHAASPFAPATRPPSACPSVCLSACPCICLPICLRTLPSARPSTRLSVHLSLSLSVLLAGRPLSALLSACPSVWLPSPPPAPALKMHLLPRGWRRRGSAPRRAHSRRARPSGPPACRR
jgi:hypothetical protein